MTINGIPYTSAKALNLKGVSSVKGSTLRFARTSSANPFDSSSYGLYINASGQLIYAAAGQSTTLGSVVGGAGSIPSLDAIFQGDQTLNLGGLSTLTIDRSSGNNNVLTMTNTGAGSGHLIQITNVGTGKDINGTSDTWSFSKTGAAVLLTITAAGTAGSDSITLTAGDMVLSDGSITVTDADNAATFSVTNNTASSASVFVFAGSGVFTGSTTTSFFTITPSGLTTGTAVYLPVSAITTGKGLHVVGNALTSGNLIVVTSSGAGTQITGAGRLFVSDHTGNAAGSAVLNEFKTAAADETILLQLTATAALATGTVLKISASSATTAKLVLFSAAALTTGVGVDMTDLAALTTGQAVSIAHATSVLADGGSLLRLASTGINTGGATNATMLDIQTTSQVAGTQVLMKAGAVTTGVLLSLITTTGLTSGSVIRATTSTAGAIATNGAFSFTATGNFTVGASTLGAFHVAATATAAGTIMSILGGALTTGIALNITDSTTGMTSGSLLRVISGSTGAVATNGIVSFQATGAFTSTTIGAVNVIISGATAGTGMALQMSASSQTSGIGFRIDQTNTTTGFTGSLFQVTSSSTTGAGSAINVVAVNTTAGNGILVTNNALTLGAGTLVNLVHGTSVIGAGSSMLRITSTGIDTGSTTGTLLDLAATAATTATLAMITSASLTSGIGIKIVLAGLTTGAAIDTTGIAATKQNFNMNSSTGSTAAPQTNAPTGFFKIGIGGTDQWVPYYSAT